MTNAAHDVLKARPHAEGHHAYNRRARPVDQVLCERVARRNRWTFAMAVLIGVATGGVALQLLGRVAQRSGAAETAGILACALILVLVGWVVVAAFTAMRLSAWAVWYGAHDSNLDPVSAAERQRVREDCVGLEYRPPLSLTQPLRRIVREQQAQGV